MTTEIYTLVKPVHGAMMGLIHVLRGADLLSSTPRQLALLDALAQRGVATSVPAYGHLPYVMVPGNKKLAKDKSNGRIDGMVALAMAAGAAGSHIDAPVEVFAEVW